MMMTQKIVSVARRFALVDIFTASSYGFQNCIRIRGTATNVFIRFLPQKRVYVEASSSAG